MATMPADRKKNWMLVGALAMVIYGFGNLYSPTVVVGESMAPTLNSGRVIWLDRTYYRSHRPERGEVIVFRDEAGDTYVKRVYRGPGETVHYMAAGSQFLMPVRDPFADTLKARYEDGRTSLRVKELRVPEDSVFVLGDNYAVSVDSRQLGAIPLSWIVGRAHLPADANVGLEAEFAPKPGKRLARTIAARNAAQPLSERPTVQRPVRNESTAHQTPSTAGDAIPEQAVYREGPGSFEPFQVSLR